MATELEVANMALSLLDEAPITALNQDVKAARLCNLHFAQVRKAELAANDWHFATVSEDLTGTETDGVWAYDLPAGFLRLVAPLTYDNEVSGVPITWNIADGVLYSDQESPRGITYIQDVTDPANWAPLFVDVMAAALALKIAHALTHKASMIQIAQNAYDRALHRARVVNSIEKSGRYYDADWAAHRGDTRYWRS